MLAGEGDVSGDEDVAQLDVDSDVAGYQLSQNWSDVLAFVDRSRVGGEQASVPRKAGNRAVEVAGAEQLRQREAGETETGMRWCFSFHINKLNAKLVRSASGVGSTGTDEPILCCTRQYSLPKEESMTATKLRGCVRVLALLGVLAAALTATGAAARTTSIHLDAGNLVADLGMFFTPTKLPHTEYAAIKAGVFGKLRTKDGSVPPPLTHVDFEADKNSKIETRGLAVCTKGKLVATTPGKARRACADAIVGTGTGSGMVVFPEQAPIPASSPVTIFNGPPVDGDPTVIVHAHLTVPAPTTYLVAVRIERVNKGPIGYRISSDLPKIAGGYGSVMDFRFRLNRKWRYRGEELSYLNARCGVPGTHLLGHVGAQFADGTDVRGSLFASCQVR